MIVSEIFDFYLDSKCSSCLIKSNRFFFISLLCRILLMFLKNETNGDSRLTTAWKLYDSFSDDS